MCTTSPRPITLMCIAQSTQSLQQANGCQERFSGLEIQQYSPPEVRSGLQHVRTVWSLFSSSEPAVHLEMLTVWPEENHSCVNLFKTFIRKEIQNNMLFYFDGVIKIVTLCITFSIRVYI